MRDVIAWLFGVGLMINSLLFVPQALAIWRAKKAVGISILTFLGFNAMQLVGALHGYFEHDWALMAGMLASFVTCGCVTVLALIFSKTKAVEV